MDTEQANRIEAKLDKLLGMAEDLKAKAESFELPPVLAKMLGRG